MGETFQLDLDLLNKLLDIKEEKIKMDENEIIVLFKRYLKEIRKLSRLIDEFGG